MTIKAINQRYSARHLAPTGQALNRNAIAVLSRQLAVLKAVNRGDGYPDAVSRRRQECGLTFWRTACGNKVVGIH